MQNMLYVKIPPKKTITKATYNAIENSHWR